MHFGSWNHWNPRNQGFQSQKSLKSAISGLPSCHRILLILATIQYLILLVPNTGLPKQYYHGSPPPFDNSGPARIERLRESQRGLWSFNLTPFSLSLSLSLSLVLSHIIISVCLSVSLSVCLSACLSVCLSVCLSICLSVCLYVCLSVCLCLHLNNT